MSKDPIEFPDAVALFLREFRSTHGITQPQLQRRARDHYGATWSRGTVSGFEAGRGAMTVPTLLVLASALSDLSGEALSISDLVQGAHDITITPTLSVSTPTLKRLLRGDPADLSEGPGVNREKSVEEIVLKVFEETKFDPKFGDAQEEVDARSEVREWPASLAIERASQRLGIPVGSFQLWSFSLWGQPLDKEIVDRVGLNASAQKRGHVTRQLVREIDQAVGPRRV